jgi:peroxiredoxin
MSPTGHSPKAPASARPKRYGWVVGIVGLLVVIYISINTLRTNGPGSAGLTPGERLLPFAAPLVTSDLVGDANVATRANQGQAGAEPACDVDDPRALNVCTLERRGPVVLAFLTDDSNKCVDELDAMQQVASRFPEVSFAAVGIKGSRQAFRALVSRHGWTFPVAQDRDGAVANLYGVAVCPTVVLAHRGGTVMETALGDEVATPAALSAKVSALERGAT